MSLGGSDAKFEHRNVLGLGSESLEILVKKVSDTIKTSGRLARGSEGEQAETPDGASLEGWLFMLSQIESTR